MRNVVDSGVTDSDLRRALISYLVGYCFYIIFILAQVDRWITKFATPPSGTVSDPSIVYTLSPVGIALSLLLMLFSQVWYLGLKRPWHQSESYSQFLKLARARIGILLLSFLIMGVLVYPDPLKPLFWIFLLGTFVYLFIIVGWNIESALSKD